MQIDFDQLRHDMISESYGAFFGGGFGGAVIEASDIETASDQKLIEIAQRRGIDIQKYVVSE